MLHTDILPPLSPSVSSSATIATSSMNESMAKASPPSQSYTSQEELLLPNEVMLMKTRSMFRWSLLLFVLSFLMFASTFSLIVNHGGALICEKRATLTPNAMPGVSKENQAKTGPLNDETMEDLLVGYKILHDTLRKESQLKYLHWLRDATFNGPKGSLKTIMTRIYTTSQKLAGELEDLWQEYHPRVLIEQAPVSPMGDSIQADVEKSSTSELVPLPSLPLLLFTASTAVSSAASSSDSDLQRLQWGIRFVFIQAQATRMVVALSTSLKKFETNQQRRQWLTELAKEFESIRESLVEYILRNLDEGAWKD